MTVNGTNVATSDKVLYLRASNVVGAPLVKKTSAVIIKYGE